MPSARKAAGTRLNESTPIAALLLLLLMAISARADDAILTPRVEKEIAYLAGAEQTDDYAKSQCKLDLHLPATPTTGFPLVVWFHGGGLTGGNKAGDKGLFKRLNDQGIAVASVGYRFSPKVKYPTYLQDAAKAVAWCVANGEKKGVDPKSIFVSGHSAGGYITAMLAMDERLLKDVGVPADKIAGYMPVSGQMLTHYTIREERGMKKQNLFADDAAPVFHIRKNVQPMLVLVGDHDMAIRLEENQLFVSAMRQSAGNKTTTLVIAEDRDHGTINGKLLTPGDKAGEAFLAFVKKWGGSAEKSEAKN